MLVVIKIKVCPDKLHKYTIPVTMTSRKNIPTHAVLSALSLDPEPQLWHMLPPSTAHVAPDAGVPFGHKQTLATHSLLSSLIFHPVLQADTSHPDEYDTACSTSQAAHIYTACQKYTHESESEGGRA